MSVVLPGKKRETITDFTKLLLRRDKRIAHALHKLVRTEFEQRPLLNAAGLKHRSEIWFDGSEGPEMDCWEPEFPFSPNWDESVNTIMNS